jgi:putative membrane protein
LKVIARIGFLLGICALILLVAKTGTGAVLQLLSRTKWLLPWLVPLHVLPLLLDAAGWRALLAVSCELQKLLWIAAVREAINRLLPVANIGGEVIGVNLLVRQGVGASRAAASVVVETLLTMVSQLVFASIGMICLIQVAGTEAFAIKILVSLGLSVLVILAFGTLLRHGSAFHRIERAATALLAKAPGEITVFNGRSLDQCIRDLLGAPKRIASAVFWQVGGLLSGCIETWLVLSWLGHPVSAKAAIAVESLVQGARSLFFMVPGGLGVQELGLMGLGRLIGMDADVAVSLSLAKRLRELLFGLPALGAWQLWEARWWRARVHRPTGS